MTFNFDRSDNSFIRGQVGDKAFPWRKVKSVCYLETTKPHGFAPASDVYRHLLECGHIQDRTESRSHVKKARCWQCGHLRERGK